MMPDLGKYAVEVAASYLSSLALIGLLVVLSVRRWRKTRDALAAVEARRRGDG